MGCAFEVGEESPCTHIVHGGNLDAAGGVHPGGQRLLVGRAWFHAKKGGFRKGECECCRKPGEGGGWQRSGVFCSVGHRCCMATFNGGVCMWPRRTDRDVRSAPPPSNAQACVRSCAFPRVPSSFSTPHPISLSPTKFLAQNRGGWIFDLPRRCWKPAPAPLSVLSPPSPSAPASLHRTFFFQPI